MAPDKLSLLFLFPYSIVGLWSVLWTFLGVPSQRKWEVHVQNVWVCFGMRLFGRGTCFSQSHCILQAGIMVPWVNSTATPVFHSPLGSWIRRSGNRKYQLYFLEPPLLSRLCQIVMLKPASRSLWHSRPKSSDRTRKGKHHFLDKQLNAEIL